MVTAVLETASWAVGLVAEPWDWSDRRLEASGLAELVLRYWAKNRLKASAWS